MKQIIKKFLIIPKISELKTSLELAREYGLGFEFNDFFMPNILDAYWNGILNEFPDMNIYLENMFDSAPDIMAQLAERICSNANFGICFDYAHAALTAVSQREWTEKLGKYVRHIHINDNDLQSDLHLAVGDGKIDWNEFYGLYDDYMDKATILIETSSLENQRRSVERLISDGLIKRYIYNE